MSYTTNDNYVNQAEQWQSVPLNGEADLEDRENTNYSCADNYQMGVIQDDHIFVLTTDDQHAQIINNEAPNANGGVSGYFTDQATIDNCTHDGVLDNGQLNRELQVAPYQDQENSIPSYKPHADCFHINHDTLEENYGTRDFNAAVAKCEANNQFGEGGGNQGFNPYLSEMISNGSLEHDANKSFSDSSLSDLDSKALNSGTISNSELNQGTYDKMMRDAVIRTDDCIEHNTAHPSQSVIDETGYAHNTDPVQGVTGHATFINNNDHQNNKQASNQTGTHSPPEPKLSGSGEDNAPIPSAKGINGEKYSDDSSPIPPAKGMNGENYDDSGDIKGMLKSSTHNNGSPDSGPSHDKGMGM